MMTMTMTLHSLRRYLVTLRTSACLHRVINNLIKILYSSVLLADITSCFHGYLFITILTSSVQSMTINRFKDFIYMCTECTRYQNPQSTRFHFHERYNICKCKINSSRLKFLYFSHLPDRHTGKNSISIV